MRRLLYPLAGAAALLGFEAALARKRTYLSPDSAPPIEGVYGSGSPSTLVMLGESTAAGVGATVQAGTVGAHLCALLAARRLPTRLVSVAVSGSRTRDLGPQVSRALLNAPDVAVILIGANDAMKLSSRRRVAAELKDAIDRLHDVGVLVVVGTCPDLGTAMSFEQPLRTIAAWYGSQVARTQARVCEASGATVVDIAAETGPRIRSDTGRYLSIDRLHPSDAGYALFAEALVGPVAELLEARTPVLP